MNSISEQLQNEKSKEEPSNQLGSLELLWSIYPESLTLFEDMLVSGGENGT